jgi:hypothetical protein
MKVCYGFIVIGWLKSLRLGIKAPFGYCMMRQVLGGFLADQFGFLIKDF